MYNFACVITPLPTNSTYLLNNFFKKGILLIASFFIFIIFQSSLGFAQRVHSNEASHSSIHLPLKYSQDEQFKRSYKNIQYSYYNNPNRNASVNCPPNIDFEEGTFNHWICDTGFVRGVDGVIGGVFGAFGEGDSFLSFSPPNNLLNKLAPPTPAAIDPNNPNPPSD